MAERKSRWINRLLIPVPVHLAPCGCWKTGFAEADNEYSWSKVRVLPDTEIDYRCKSFTETVSVDGKTVTVSGHRPIFRCLECGETFEGSKRYRESPYELAEEPDLTEDQILAKYKELSQLLKSGEGSAKVIMAQQDDLEKMWRQHGNEVPDLYDELPSVES